MKSLDNGRITKKNITGEKNREKSGYGSLLTLIVCFCCIGLAACGRSLGGQEQAGELSGGEVTVGEANAGKEDAGSEGAEQSIADQSSADQDTADQSSAGATETEDVPQSPEPPDLHPFDITLTFAGDISFSEDSAVMANYKAKGEDISAVIDPKLIEKMRDADIMWINNEFTYSNRGEPFPGKAYTFRANPERVDILHELGVDVAGLANNHVYDYGEDSLYDTLETLEAADIPYVGAGHDLEEAMRPLYLEVDDKVISFVAASRAEKNKMTPQATKESPGILRCYDTELFLQEIEEACANSDYCIALVHWGTEYSTVLEDVQLTTGKAYLDAGADAVIGGHSHCLQGFEFYDGKPIAYSLGNFWFNSKTLDTMLVTLHLWGDDTESNLEVIVTPALQAGCVTVEIDGEAARTLFDTLEEISVDVRIGDDGVVKPKE